VDIASWLQSQWAAISAAPAVYLVTIVIIWVAAAKFTRSRLGDEAAAARERVEHFRQRVSELEGQKSELLNKLQAHGEDIAAIKHELATRPRIYVGPDEPKDAKDGDLWVQ
jgi:hypothetical protein